MPDPASRLSSTAAPVGDGGPLSRPRRWTVPAGRVGHGFAVTPAYYFRLLRAWAQAGYVVAAPVSSLGNAHAPGGPAEADILNQPGDMSFVITHLLTAGADRRNPLAGLIDPGAVAVTGQSDGGETALAVAYDRYYRDLRNPDPRSTSRLDR